MMYRNYNIPAGLQFVILNENICDIHADAYVNSTNRQLAGASGADLEIHSLGGPEFQEECDELIGSLSLGEARYTGAYGDLKCRYVIHTIGPHYTDGEHGEPAILRSCYIQSLKLADELDLRTVAMPLISAGYHGFPVERALEIAVTTVREYLEHSNLKRVMLTLYGDAAEMAASIEVPGLEEADRLLEGDESCSDEEPADILADICENDAFRISHLYSGRAAQESSKRISAPRKIAAIEKERDSLTEKAECCEIMPCGSGYFDPEKMKDPKIGESLSDMLIRLASERGMSDSDVYHRAGINKASYNKIINNKTRRPMRQTVAAIAIAMELDFETAEDLMRAAGLAFSNNDPFDVIVSSCIKAGYYNVWKINSALSDRNLPILAQTSREV